MAGDVALEAAIDSVRSGVFDNDIAKVIVDTVRSGRDDGLSKVGFLMKITVELIDRSNSPLPYAKARQMADDIYAQFRRDNAMVKFGSEGWDWSGHGARILAHEYEISYWEN